MVPVPCMTGWADEKIPVPKEEGKCSQVSKQEDKQVGIFRQNQTRLTYHSIKDQANDIK